MKKFLTAFLLLCVGTTSVFAKETYSSDCRYKYVPLHRKKLEQALSSHLPDTERGVVAGDLFFKYLYESDDSSIDCNGFISVCRVADMDSNSCIKMFNELIDIEENTNNPDSIQAIFDKYCSEHIDECDCKRVIKKPTYNPAPTDYTYTDCKFKFESDVKNDEIMKAIKELCPSSDNCLITDLPPYDDMPLKDIYTHQDEIVTLPAAIEIARKESNFYFCESVDNTVWCYKDGNQVVFHFKHLINDIHEHNQPTNLVYESTEIEGRVKHNDKYKDKTVIAPEAYELAKKETSLHHCNVVDDDTVRCHEKDEDGASEIFYFKKIEKSEYHKDVSFRARNHNGSCLAKIDDAEFSIMSGDSEFCEGLKKDEWEITYKSAKYRGISGCSTSQLEYKPSDAGQVCYCNGLNGYGWVKCPRIPAGFPGSTCAGYCNSFCAQEAYDNLDFRSKLGIK